MSLDQNKISEILGSTPYRLGDRADFWCANCARIRTVTIGMRVPRCPKCAHQTRPATDVEAERRGVIRDDSDAEHLDVQEEDETEADRG